MTDPLSLNLYTYGLNNPIAYIDPSGHRVEQAFEDQIEPYIPKKPSKNSKPSTGKNKDKTNKVDTSTTKPTYDTEEEEILENIKIHKKSDEYKESLPAKSPSKKPSNDIPDIKTQPTPSPKEPVEEIEADLIIIEEKHEPVTTNRSTRDNVLPPEIIEVVIDDKPNNTPNKTDRTDRNLIDPETREEVVLGSDSHDYKLSETDSASIIALRRLYSEYESENNESGMDATIRSIQELQQKNGVPVEDYDFASEDKTTRVLIMKSKTYTLKDIHKAHNGITMLNFLAGLIPGVGLFFGPLMTAVNYAEQEYEDTPLSVAKSVVTSVIGAKSPGYGTGLSDIDTYDSLKEEKKNTFNVDGVTIQGKDSYVQIRASTNQGIDHKTIEVYIRDNKIISYKVFSNEGYNNNPRFSNYDYVIRSEWKKDGYK